MRMSRAAVRTGRCKPVDQNVQTVALRSQAPFILDRETFHCWRISVGTVRRFRKPAASAGARPSAPSNILGGVLSPRASSKAAAQCASAWAAFILPHKRWLSGRNCAIRALTSSYFQLLTGYSLCSSNDGMRPRFHRRLLHSLWRRQIGRSRGAQHTPIYSYTKI